MNRLRAILFTLIVLLFPAAQFFGWAQSSSAIRAFVGNVGLERAFSIGTTTTDQQDVVTRLRQDDPGESFESRFAPLRPFLRPDQHIGFVTDRAWPAGGSRGPERAFLFAQYALAPLVLTDSDTSKYVVASFSSESVLDMMAEGKGTVCSKRQVPVDSNETSDRLDEPLLIQPVIAAPRLRPLDYLRQIYRCDKSTFRIVRRFGDGVAILESVSLGQ